MTLQMHMNPTVILPKPTPDSDAEPSGGIGWKTTIRVFEGDADTEIEEPTQ